MGVELAGDLSGALETLHFDAEGRHAVFVESEERNDLVTSRAPEMGGYCLFQWGPEEVKDRETSIKVAVFVAIEDVELASLLYEEH